MHHASTVRRPRLRLVKQPPGQQTCGVCVVAILGRVPVKAAAALLPPDAPQKGTSAPEVAKALTILTGRRWRVQRLRQKPLLHDAVLPMADVALIIRNVFKPGTGGHFIALTAGGLVYDPEAPGPIDLGCCRLGRGYRVVAAVVPADA